MPKNSQYDAISRILEIVKKLPSRAPGITARDLMGRLKDSGFKCSKRTVERDLNEIATRLPVICNDKSIPYGWHWMTDNAPDLPSLTVADAMSLHLVEDLLRPLLPGAMLESLAPRFRHAQNKLAALAETNPNARWLEKVRQVPPTLPLLPPKIADGVLETLQEALLSDMQLEADYQRPDAEEPQTLRLHPLGLVQRGPVTYLVATAFDYTDVRVFAVHRVRKARKLAEPVRRPDGFSLDDYIRHGSLHFGNGEAIRLVAWIDDWLAGILTETPLSVDQQLEENKGKHLLTATLNDTWQLRWWILSQGSGLVVVEPVELRKEVARTLRRAARPYAGKT